jgi:hypothetical protein
MSYSDAIKRGHDIEEKTGISSISVSPFEIEESEEENILRGTKSRSEWSARNYILLAIGGGLSYGTQNFLMSFFI